VVIVKSDFTAVVDVTLPTVTAVGVVEEMFGFAVDSSVLKLTVVILLVRVTVPVGIKVIVVGPSVVDSVDLVAVVSNSVCVVTLAVGTAVGLATVGVAEVLAVSLSIGGDNVVIVESVLTAAVLVMLPVLAVVKAVDEMFSVVADSCKVKVDVLVSIVGVTAAVGKVPVVAGLIVLGSVNMNDVAVTSVVTLPIVTDEGAVEEMFGGFVVNTSKVTVSTLALLVGETVVVGMEVVSVGITVVVSADIVDIVNICGDVVMLAAGIAVDVLDVAGILSVSLSVG